MSAPKNRLLLFSLLCLSAAFSAEAVAQRITQPDSALASDSALVQNLPELPEGVHAAIVFEPYVVSGSSAEALTEAMRAKGPRLSVNGDTTRRPFQARTNWHIRWRFKHGLEEGTQEDNTACVVRDVQVDLDVRMTLPQWEVPPNAPPRLVRQWERYKEALRHHENAHRDHGFFAARHTYRAIKNLRSASCETMQEKAEQIAARIRERYVRAGRRYDRETNHGRTEGVVWPPKDDAEQ